MMTRMRGRWGCTEVCGFTLLAVGLLMLVSGCVQIKAPERINIGGEPPPPVDSSRVPPTSTHEEARAELVKAYQNIQYLEQQNARLRSKADEYKRERDECRKQLKKYEKD